MTKKRLVLFGAGGHAKSIVNAIDPEYFNDVSTVTWGLQKIDTNLGLRNSHFSKLSSLDFNEETEYIVAIGNQEIRAQLISELCSCFPLMRFATVISKNSNVSKDAIIGNGVYVGSGVYVGPGCEIGNHVVLNTASIVEHDCKIGDRVVIAPSVSIGGGSTVENNSFLGIGAIVRDGIRIKNGSVIGAASLVLTDIVISGLYFGVPAKLKSNLQA
jgi:sugar O-acyltransferase (sialic acid O-acetyltransferase NeuD family)